MGCLFSKLTIDGQLYSNHASVINFAKFCSQASLLLRSLVWQMLEREQALEYGDMARSDSIITLTSPARRSWRQMFSSLCWGS